MTRRPTAPQAAAFLASLSVNALLFLGLRQIGTLSSDATADDVAPLLVLELEAQDAPARPRQERRPQDRSKASRRRTASRHRQPAATTVDVSTVPASAPPALRVTDDSWQRPARNPGRKAFPTAFQRSLAEPAPSVEPPSVLAGVTFRDGSFVGFLARLGKMTDCGELHAAMAHHPGSAATIARTMERLGCNE